ncbi:hypothetical protein FWF48_00080 [Candidatus Saccharibacteria bacterium]|nr:hypothetical protein [Candidatus Saccharibacteria bacterium]
MKVLQKIAKIPLPVLILMTIIIVMIVAIFIASSPTGEQQFSDLALSFLRGHLYFWDNQLRGDATLFNSHYYWSLGIFPALLITPFMAIFQLFGGYFYQEYLFVPLVVLALYLIYRLARRFNYSGQDAGYLVIVGLAGTSLLGIAPIAMSWYLASLIGFVLLLLALVEFFGKRRYWVLGVLTGLLVLTRPPAAVALAVFLILDMFLAQKIEFCRIFSWQNWCKLAKVALPIILALVIFCTYNYARFSNPLETGYAQQIYPNVQINKYDIAARQYGIFNIRHIPGQLYNMFFSMPTPVYYHGKAPVLTPPFIRSNRYGMSLFLISPWLLWLFTVRRKHWSKVAVFLLIAASAGILLNACFFGLGYGLFGLRYSLDFLPFLMCALFMLYHRQNKQLTRGMKSLIVISALFNLYLLLTAI